MNILMYAEHGSYLYGTNNHTSDKDYKGIFLPDIKDLLLCDFKKTMVDNTGGHINKNTSDDVDKTLYSLQYFIELASKGETVALDMIHIPPDKCISTHKIWEELYQNRNKFYTKNMKAFLGYCKTQAHKYGIRGSRISDTKKVLMYLQNFNDDIKFGLVVDNLPDGEHIRKKMVVEECREKNNVCVDICGKKMMYTTPIKYVKQSLEKFIDNYGERARMASENKGIDWKAISHAFRAGLQLKEIYETGDLIYPLKDRKFLTDIKEGKYHYVKDNIGQSLSELINDVEILSNQSVYPEKVNHDFWCDFIINAYSTISF